MPSCGVLKPLEPRETHLVSLNAQRSAVKVDVKLLKREKSQDTLFRFFSSLAPLRLAQSLESDTLNLRVVGSGPTLGANVGFPSLLLVSENDTTHRISTTWSFNYR